MPPLTTEIPAAATSSVRSRVGEKMGTFEGAFLAFLEIGRRRDLERHGLGRDDVLQRAALLAGEDGGVDLAAFSSLLRIMPPRGPRRVLCVVVVTTSA